MPPKAKSKAYQLATIDAEGLTVTDNCKKDWKVGAPVGIGGFGRLYQATDVSGGTGSSYVIKIEPFENGPLFCEQKFYMNKAKESVVKEYIRARKLKKLGVPWHVTSGQHSDSKAKYRFMIIPQYKTDLQKLFIQCNKRFPLKTVLTVAMQVLDSLEYIHTGTPQYVHADIKAANLLLDLKDPNLVVLVDYGLAMKCIIEGKHREYKPDPRKAHNGTIEFTSLDAHAGCDPSRRADLEILGYCCIQWLCSQLPWEICLTQPDKVKSLKEQFMNGLPGSLKKLSKEIPQCLIDYMVYVKGLDYDSEPDYKYLHKCFKAGLKKEKLSADGKLEFPVDSKAGTSGKRKSMSDDGPAPKRRSRGSPKATTSKGKSAASKRKPTGKAAATTKRKAPTIKPVKVEDNSSDSTTSDVKNKNNSAARRKSMNPQAMKVLKKAKTAATGAAKRKSIVAKPAGRANLALQHSISPMAARAMKETAAARKESALAAKSSRVVKSSRVANSPRVTNSPRVVNSPRVATLKTSTATQTSPGLQGLKNRKVTKQRPKRTSK